MAKIFLQELRAKLSQEFIRKSGLKPGSGSSLVASDETQFTYFWVTVATVETTYQAKKVRLPFQRIARPAGGRYPRTVIDAAGKGLYIVENATLPAEALRAEARRMIRYTEPMFDSVQPVS